MAGEQVVERAAKTVQIRPVIDPVRVGDLLGRDVIERAHDLPVLREPVRVAPRLAQQRQAEVEELHLAAPGEDQVRGLEVAVNHVELMDLLEAERGLPDHLAGHVHRQGTMLLHEPRQVGPLDELHDQVMLPLGLARVLGVDDVRVLELRDRRDLRAGTASRPRDRRAGRSASASARPRG